MKKLLSYLLVAMMVFGLVACGSDTKKTDKKEEAVKSNANAVEVLEKAIDNIDSINAVEANLTVEGSAAAEGQEVEVKASVDFVGNNLGKDNMEIKIPVKLSATGEGEIEAALYYKDGFIYADTAALLGQNLKLELDLTDIVPEIDATTQEEVTDETTEEEAKKIEEALNLTIKETETKYVLTMDVDYDKFVALIAEQMSSEDMSAFEMLDFKTFNMTMSATKDGVIDEITLDISATVDAEGTAVDVTIKGNIAFKAGNIDITFPDFSDYVDASMLLNQLMGN